MVVAQFISRSPFASSADLVRSRARALTNFHRPSAQRSHKIMPKFIEKQALNTIVHIGRYDARSLLVLLQKKFNSKRQWTLFSYLTLLICAPKVFTKHFRKTYFCIKLTHSFTRSLLAGYEQLLWEYQDWFLFRYEFIHHALFAQ